MLSNFKGKTPDQDEGGSASGVTGPTGRPHRPGVDSSVTRGEPATAGQMSSIGSGMSIVGTVECNGPAQVFGRIDGELRASDLLIGDGANLDGNIIAQDVTICGRVKGTIRAVRVRLQGGGAVEGDIFHRSLSIDESSLFEGSSRRVENPTEMPSSLDGKGTQRKGTQNLALPVAADADVQRR